LHGQREAQADLDDPQQARINVQAAEKMNTENLKNAFMIAGIQQTCCS
jgi:hypothetical protein